VVVLLFVVAAGAAAGIAALRGPIRPSSPTPAQERAAAKNVVLKASDFPAGWKVTSAASAASTAGSYGVGSVLVTSSIVQFWLNVHPGCAVTLDTLSSAMMPFAGNSTAVASTAATNQSPLGGSWQITNAVSYRPTSAEVAAQTAAVRSVLAGPSKRACIGQFWAAALTAELPLGSQVAMTVSNPPVPPLTGNPPAWAMSMSGVAMVRHVAIPISFEMTGLAVGRAEVLFATSAKDAPLFSGLDRSLLGTLAARAQRYIP
jgi:hypothetical protein